MSVAFERYGRIPRRQTQSGDYMSVLISAFRGETFDLSDERVISAYQKADIFGLGVLMSEILTGKEVFGRDWTAADISRRMRRGYLGRMPGNFSVHREVRELIVRCLDADASKRPSIDDIWVAIWSIDCAIDDAADSRILTSRFHSSAPPPMCLEALDQLPNECCVDRGPLRSDDNRPVCRLQIRVGREFGDFAVTYYEQGGSHEGGRKRFAELIQIFQQVSHPCLARIVRAVPPTAEQGPVLWTDYFNCGSLGRYLKQVRLRESVRRFTPTEQVVIICGLVVGLLELHSHDLFHGSLSPSDISIDSAFNVHLTDYISCSLEQWDLTGPVATNRTKYTAPECWEMEMRGKCFSALQMGDVFSAGVIMYEILTGREVFSSELSAAELRRKTDSPERPPIPGSIKHEFGQLIERCWDSDPRMRPSIGKVWHILKTKLKFEIIEGVKSADVESHVSQWSRQ